MIGSERLVFMLVHLVIQLVSAYAFWRAGYHKGIGKGLRLAQDIWKKTVDDKIAEATNGLPHYRCPHCGSVSYSRGDIEHKFCARCDKFEGEPR